MEPSKDATSAAQSEVPNDMEKTSTPDEFVTTLTPAQQKRTIRTLDLRVTVVLGVLYLIGQIDRNNLGNANIAGMSRDLELSSTRYSIILLIIFLTYSTTQTITLILLRKFGPRIFYTVSASAWGVLVIGIAFVKNWYEVLPLRVILGFFESGMLPGGVLILSCYYTRYELQIRLAGFYAIGIAASAFAGIISWGVAKMDGLGSGPAYWGRGLLDKAGTAGKLTGEHAPGIAGWRWIFIIFGVVTFSVVIVCFPLIVNFPEKQTTDQRLAFKFLNQEQLDWVVNRIQREREDVYAEDFSIKFYIKQLADVDLWAYVVMFMAATATSYAVIYFLPIILRQGLGFDVATAQLLTAPPYIFAGIVMLVLGWASDRTQIRSPWLLGSMIANIVGVLLLGWTSSIGSRMFGIFLVTAGGSSNIPAVLAWQANNIRGQWKRTMSSAMALFAGGLGGVLGSTTFRTEDAPRYFPGCGMIIATNGAAIVVLMLMVYKYRRANRLADTGEKVILGLASFRYTL